MKKNNFSYLFQQNKNYINYWPFGVHDTYNTPLIINIFRRENNEDYRNNKDIKKNKIQEKIKNKIDPKHGKGSDGDKDSYDKEGYDKNGYNKEGYDKGGYNKEGY
ncbi:hypothetical protein, partial [Wolbachia pipientis]